MNVPLAASSSGDIDTCARGAARPTVACEPLSTPRHTTPSRLAAFALALALAPMLVACGGGGGKKRGDTYAAATSAQEACCEHLVPGPREDCLKDIVRVSDDAVAHSTANQDTYACVQEHFACDPGTGRATQASAQAQLDCIQDLP